MKTKKIPYLGRTLDENVPELKPYLRPGANVLDVGCDPGTITLGVAEAVKPGEVVGIDLDEERGYETLIVDGQPDWEGWMARFWEQSLSPWDDMFRVGVRSDMVSSCFAMPLMLPHREGLVVNTTISTGQTQAGANLFYWLAKIAVNRMELGMAVELKEYNIAVVALAPGWLRTAYILQTYKTDDINAHKVKDLWKSESTEYAGQAVVALATDPNMMERTGQLLVTREMGPEYGFTDVDGRQPPL